MGRVCPGIVYGSVHASEPRTKEYSASMNSHLSKKTFLAMTLLSLALAAVGCRDRAPRPAPPSVTPAPGTAPQKENARDEGKPEVNNDPGDSINDGNSRSSSSLSPSPSNEAGSPDDTRGNENSTTSDGRDGSQTR